MASGINTFSIVIGKIISTLLISYIGTIIIMFVLKFGFYFSGESIDFISFSIFDFILPLTTQYLFCCICICTSILVKEEKIVPMASMAAMVCLVVPIIYGLSKVISFNYLIMTITIIFVLLCIALTFLTSEILKKSNLVTRI